MNKVDLGDSLQDQLGCSVQRFPLQAYALQASQPDSLRNLLGTRLVIVVCDVLRVSLWNSIYWKLQSTLRGSLRIQLQNELSERVSDAFELGASLAGAGMLRPAYAMALIHVTTQSLRGRLVNLFYIPALGVLTGVQGELGRELKERLK